MLSKNFKDFVKTVPVHERLSWIHQLRMQRDQPILGTVEEQREYVAFEQAHINYMCAEWGYGQMA